MILTLRMFETFHMKKNCKSVQLVIRKDDISLRLPWYLQLSKSVVKIVIYDCYAKKQVIIHICYMKSPSWLRKIQLSFTASE